MTTNEDLLFVELALKRELVTQEQVDEILAVQKKLAEMDLTESVADLMVKKGVLAAKDAEAIRVKVSPKGGRQQITGYRLVERLGRGGMGSVYRGVQVSMGRTVAIKVLKPSLAKDDSRIERLRREAQLVGQLKHANIVQGLDFGTSHGFHYFAMEYVDGPSVKVILEEEGTLKEKPALRIVKEVALALEYAHLKGIVHRDVKPGNILVAKDGSVRLADYGLAKGPLEDVELTHSGVTMGTPQYISPEQAQGPSDVDIRTDLYSLGATLYHMVTGRPPYEGETLAHLIQQVLYEPYAPPRSIRRDLSPNVAFLIEKLMARKPRHRYQTPQELLRDLDAIEAGRSIIPSGWEGDFEAYHLRRRMRRLFYAAGVIVALCAAVAGFFVWKTKQWERIQKEQAAVVRFEPFQEVVPERERLKQTIAELEKFVDEFGDTEKGPEAKELLAKYRAEQRLFARYLENTKDAGALARNREWAKAIACAERGKEEMAEKGEGARRVVAEYDKYIGELRVGRDAEVNRYFEDMLREFLRTGESPELALERLSAELVTVEQRAYLEGEKRTALGPTRDLTANLNAALTLTARHLGPARALLQAEGTRRNYREIAAALERGLEEFREDSAIKAAFAELPQAWQDSLAKDFVRVEEAMVAANRAEAVTVLAEAVELRSQGQFEQAIQALADLRDRSIDEALGPVHTALTETEQALTSLREEAERAWKDFLPRFTESLGKREWAGTAGLIAQLHQIAARFTPNDYILDLIPGAQTLLDHCRSIESTFVRRVQALGALPDGLRFGTVRFAPVSDVVVEAGTIRFAFKGTVRSKPLSEVSVEDLLRYSGEADDQSPKRAAHGILLLGELRQMKDPRQRLAGMQKVEDEILKGRADPGFAPLADALVATVREETATVRDMLTGSEKAAQAIYEGAVAAYKAGQWTEAYRMLSELLEDPGFSETDYVKYHQSSIESLREEAKKRLPVAGMLRYYRASRADWVAGASVNRGNYEAALSFDLETPEELRRFTFTPGRIGLVAVKKMLLGPTPEDDAEARTLTEHLLSFLPPKTEAPEEWLSKHPLRIESPFLYSRAMSIEFRVRWDHPLAFLISLCGTNVVVLSSDGRPENGRGVHIWQSSELLRPDLAVPPDLRNTWIRDHPEVLAGEEAQRRYFQFEGERWYRVRFAKTEKTASLTVDGRLVLEREIEQYRAKTGEIVLLTWTPCQVDEFRIEGTVDPEWYHRRVR